MSQDWKYLECANCGWVGSEDDQLSVPDLEFGEGVNIHFCPDCYHADFYQAADDEVTGSANPAIRFGNYLNQFYEKWGDEWADQDGNNHTTRQVYKKFIAGLEKKKSQVKTDL